MGRKQTTGDGTRKLQKPPLKSESELFSQECQEDVKVSLMRNKFNFLEIKKAFFPSVPEDGNLSVEILADVPSPGS